MNSTGRKTHGSSSPLRAPSCCAQDGFSHRAQLRRSGEAEAGLCPDTIATVCLDKSQLRWSGGDPWWGPHEKPSDPLTELLAGRLFYSKWCPETIFDEVGGEELEREKCEGLQDTIAPFSGTALWLFVATLRNCPRRKGLRRPMRKRCMDKSS